MIDSDDVLLLRGPGFASESGTREVVATVCQPSDAAAFGAYAARHLGPRHALHRGHAENDYPSPARPHRGGRPGLVRLGRGTALADPAAAAGTRDDLQVTAPKNASDQRE
ncbi:hypothetical protein [Streptomyces atratus]|uniref:hypothetical protein n=1 Tax=Streptomyces atratus TaxID=1893 RepID=UPI001670A6BF|nr:hypothetical protein [Streptomyces atratus]